MSDLGSRLTSIRFDNFKALPRFSIHLRTSNVIVGPNNAGKSTIVAALRVLQAALVTARSHTPAPLPDPREWHRGYRIPAESIPVSLENALTDYSGDEAEVRFSFAGNDGLNLVFPSDGGCYMQPMLASGRRIGSTADFRKAYPFDVVVVPVLGPVEAYESLLEPQTVRRNLATHRASRNFRNYWWHFGNAFEEFSELVRSTWPGLEVESPKAEVTNDGTRLLMWCRENNGPPRELFWMGIGFQVWCQLLTHVLRARDASFLAIDEPEIYLHPTMQRELLALVRSTNVPFLLATHSSDMIAECDPTELMTVDKRLPAAKRLRSAADLSLALKSVGSSQNVVLTQMARTRRMLFLEGEEFQILAAFARLLGYERLATAADFAVYPYGGFPVPDALTAIIKGVNGALAGSSVFAGVFDGDYRGTLERDAVLAQLQPSLTMVHIWERKEIENYLLIPDAMQRALDRGVAERGLRVGVGGLKPESNVSAVLEGVTDSMRQDIQGQLSGKRIDFERHKGIDSSTLASAVGRDVDKVWSDLESRLVLVPGKQVMTALNEQLQKADKVTLTWRRIVAVMRRNEVPAEVRRVVSELERFRIVGSETHESVQDAR